MMEKRLRGSLRVTYIVPYLDCQENFQTHPPPDPSLRSDPVDLQLSRRLDRFPCEPTFTLPPFFLAPHCFLLESRAEPQPLSSGTLHDLCICYRHLGGVHHLYFLRNPSSFPTHTPSYTTNTNKPHHCTNPRYRAAMGYSMPRFGSRPRWVRRHRRR